jgi:hypothetical protein
LLSRSSLKALKSDSRGFSLFAFVKIVWNRWRILSVCLLTKESIVLGALTLMPSVSSTAVCPDGSRQLLETLRSSSMPNLASGAMASGVLQKLSIRLTVNVSGEVGRSLTIFIHLSTVALTMNERRSVQRLATATPSNESFFGWLVRQRFLFEPECKKFCMKSDL